MDEQDIPAGEWTVTPVPVGMKPPAPRDGDDFAWVVFPSRQYPGKGKACTRPGFDFRGRPLPPANGGRA